MRQDVSVSLSGRKPHYQVLNGLRGVVALMVLLFHVFEGFAFAYGTEQGFAHGHLGVDFFFLLSGFVLAYAYDDRWSRGWSTGDFVRRRIIRLHPMIFIGAILGVVAFLLQGSQQWDGTAVPFAFILLAFFLQLLMLPVFPGTAADVRGNGEMFPLNGPSWSLFFEYIASFAYALLLRRLSTRALRVVALLLGVALTYFSVTEGGMWMGWTAGGNGLWAGLVRVLFPFSVGMLLARGFEPIKIKGAFWKAALVLVLIFSMPRFGSGDTMWLNGAFEAFCIIAVFPFLIVMGASDTSEEAQSNRAYKFLGDISYPLYIIHYPAFYCFYYWLTQSPDVRMDHMVAISVLLMIGCILLAYVVMKYYDEPVRKRLTSKYILRK